MTFKDFASAIDPKAFMEGFNSIFMTGVPPQNNFLDNKNDLEGLRQDAENLKKDFTKSYGMIENEFKEKK